MAALGLMAVKAAILFGAARAFRVPRAAAAETALLLAQAGEFAFVVIGVAQAGSLLAPRLAAGTIAVVGLSMMLTPVAALIGRRLAARFEVADHKANAPGDDLHDLDNHVVIGGLGRVGRLIAQALEAENVPYVGLDTDGAMINRMRAERRPVYFGDAGRTELLEKVGARKARAFVVTVNDRHAAELMVAAARKIQPEALVFARAADAAHAARLIGLGAVSVIPETVEASLQLAGRLLEGLNLPGDTVTHRVAAMRAAELERLGETS